MNKSELIIKVKEAHSHYNTATIKQAVDVFFDEITASLIRGDRVEVRGFGSFCLHRRNARLGYNPHTGRKFFISEKQMPYFRASSKLREAMTCSICPDSNLK